MPNLSCSVYKCNYNDDRLCRLNMIDVSGGERIENTCCSSFSESSGATNCSGSAIPETSISCKAHDCTYNEDCKCHAETVEVCTCRSGSSSHDSECSTFSKR